MADLDLRPLSLGEILDRTFSLYRRNFILFLGIAALPNLLVLGLNLAGTLVSTGAETPSRGGASSPLLALGIGGIIVGVIVYFLVYLLAQGGTVYAVSELYLGHTTSIGESLKKMRGRVLQLFGVTFLNGLVVGLASLALVIPGIYVACRQITCVPCALLEDLGPASSLDRSFKLTKGSAGRSFVIFLLYFIMLYAALLLFTGPFLAAIEFSKDNPGAVRMWSAMSDVGQFVCGILVEPFLTIATAVFYYDLRVRKEGFDLQLMLKASGVAAGTPSAPSLAS